jgi:hypothetical protein
MMGAGVSLLSLAACTIVLCLLGRAANVFPLSALTNLVARRTPPPRGATATLPHRVPVQAQVGVPFWSDGPGSGQG